MLAFVLLFAWMLLSSLLLFIVHCCFGCFGFVFQSVLMLLVVIGVFFIVVFVILCHSFAVGSGDRGGVTVALFVVVGRGGSSCRYLWYCCCCALGVVGGGVAFGIVMGGEH